MKQRFPGYTEASTSDRPSTSGWSKADVLPTQLGVSGYESEKGPERSPFHESRGPKRGHGMGSKACRGWGRWPKSLGDSNNRLAHIAGSRAVKSVDFVAGCARYAL